jgi:hypothetical protein
MSSDHDRNEEGAEEPGHNLGPAPGDLRRPDMYLRDLRFSSYETHSHHLNQRTLRARITAADTIDICTSSAAAY